MATINPSKWGHCRVASQASHNTARNLSTATATAANTTTNDSTLLGTQYKVDSGRGSLTYNITRAYFYFDTSAITGTVSSLRLRVQGAASATADVIVVKSTAFGGNGSANLDNDDYGNVNFSTTYSSEFTSWTSDGSNIDIDLNSTAEADVQNNDAFICAILQFDNDQQDVDAGSAVTLASGYRWSTAATQFHLTFTETATGRSVGRIGKYTKDKIARFDKYALADIANINGIDIG